MNESKHTPGPWHNPEGSVTVRGPNKEKIVDVTGSYTAAGAAVTPGHVCQANARLIAAAPDLLAALERAEGYLMGYFDSLKKNARMQTSAAECHRARENARAAIAKATKPD